MSAPEILRRRGRGQASRRCGSWPTTGCAARPTARSPSRRSRSAELVIVNELFLTETARARARRVPGQRRSPRRRAWWSTASAGCRERCARCALAQGLASRTGRSSRRSRRRWAPRWSLPQRRGRVPRDRAAGARLPGHRAGRRCCRWGRSGRREDARGRAARSRAAADGASRAGAGDGLWLLSGGTLFLQGSLSHRGQLLPQAREGARARSSIPTRRSGSASPRATRSSSRARPARCGCRPRSTTRCRRAACSCPTRYRGVELNRLGAPVGRRPAREGARAGAGADGGR